MDIWGYFRSKQQQMRMDESNCCVEIGRVEQWGDAIHRLTAGHCPFFLSQACFCPSWWMKEPKIAEASNWEVLPGKSSSRLQSKSFLLILKESYAFREVVVVVLNPKLGWKQEQRKRSCHPEGLPSWGKEETKMRSNYDIYTFSNLISYWPNGKLC
jgi:hypothetical protein